MRSLFLAVCAFLVVAMAPALLEAAPCPSKSICYTEELWGTADAANKFAKCKCDASTGEAKRTGKSCVCGVCYRREDSIIRGYDKEPNGQCKAGDTDCSACEITLPDSASGSKGATTTTPPTSTNVPGSDPASAPLTPSSSSNVSSSTSGNTGAPSSNSSRSGSGADAGNESSDKDSSMATWQIALIICSCVLVFAVIVMTIMSCYCKTRKQMKDNHDLEEETREYENYWHPGASTTAEARAVAQMGNRMNNSAISAQLTQGGRSSFTSSHSRPNSTKNMPYSEPTFAENDKIGSTGRMPARQSIGSRNDLPQVFNAFPQRPTHELDNRKNIAIEL